MYSRRIENGRHLVLDLANQLCTGGPKMHPLLRYDGLDLGAKQGQRMKSLLGRRG